MAGGAGAGSEETVETPPAGERKIGGGGGGSVGARGGGGRELELQYKGETVDLEQFKPVQPPRGQRALVSVRGEPQRGAERQRLTRKRRASLPPPLTRSLRSRSPAKPTHPRSPLTGQGLSLDLLFHPLQK